MNTVRPADKQILVYAITFQDSREIITRHGFFSQWKLLKEFRLRFPDNNLYNWYIDVMVWALSFSLVGFVLFFPQR